MESTDKVVKGLTDISFLVDPTGCLNYLNISVQDKGHLDSVGDS